jgi:hypothetical protein
MVPWLRITAYQTCDKSAAINYISEFIIDIVRLSKKKRNFIGTTTHNSTTETVSFTSSLTTDTNVL